MKGIVLAGGNGSRLRPMTLGTNKHILPVGTSPMIYHPISQLVANGITEICIVSGINHLGSVVELLGSGERFGASFSYKVQENPGGIAEALGLCRNFAGIESIAVFLGDNIFENKLNLQLGNGNDAKLFLKEVDNPEAFGVAEVDHLKRLIDIQEKPEEPKSNCAVTGAYIYSPRMWDFIRMIDVSERGELEITDLNKMILRNGKVATEDVVGWWQDAGSLNSYRKANDLVYSSLCSELDVLIYSWK
jgi:glucose-1-phosphate thymidylyltransferase